MAEAVGAAFWGRGQGGLERQFSKRIKGMSSMRGWGPSAWSEAGSRWRVKRSQGPRMAGPRCGHMASGRRARSAADRRARPGRLAECAEKHEKAAVAQADLQLQFRRTRSTVWKGERPARHPHWAAARRSEQLLTAMRTGGFAGSRVSGDGGPRPPPRSSRRR